MSILFAMIAASAAPDTVVDKSFSCQLTSGNHFNSDDDIEETTVFTKNQISAFSFNMSFFDRNGKMMVEFELSEISDVFKLNGVYYAPQSSPGTFEINRNYKDYLTASNSFSKMYVYYRPINDYNYFPEPFENFTRLMATCEPK